MSHPVESRRNLFVVIGASSAGTLIEWYDFYLFGALSTILATQFFPKENTSAAFLATLATFAAGFVVRPFGAIVFGAMGDLVGRKYTFLLTLLIMGFSTFAIGLVPSYESIGIAAPLAVLLLRLLQGLALGGEYGGAATYVAEHAPDARRGYFTSWIQTTATLGLFVSLGVILATRLWLGEADFARWGWRVPFLISVVLVGLSYLLRLKLQESPVFQRVKASGKASRNPLAESFGNSKNRRYVLLALFGATAGQGVVWYTGQFYALTFLQKTLNIDLVSSNVIVACALLAATPFFVVCGALSDRIGRKPIMMAGCLLAAASYLPIYHAMAAATDPAKATSAADGAIDTRPAVVGGAGERTVVKHITRPYTNGMIVIDTVTTVTDAAGATKETTTVMVRPGVHVGFVLGLLVFIQVMFVTMVYGPIAAFLVELFPTRIRYTSMSLPYHVGNGVFGGLVPFVATWLAGSALFAADGPLPLAKLVGGSKFVGLLYPISIAAATLVIGFLMLPETKNRQIDAD